jgi:hypothetical protein
MKITKDMVGKSVFRFVCELKGRPILILGVGESKFLGRYLADSTESAYPITDAWEFYQEPKTKHRAAPALCKYRQDPTYYISNGVFETEEDAKDTLGSALAKWPASPSSWVEWEE